MAATETAGADLAGLDALDLPVAGARPAVRRLWSGGWPKLAAVALALAVWQLVVASHWRPDYVLAGPATTLGRLAQDAGTAEFWSGVAVTLRRALFGFVVAVAVGTALGVAVSRSRVLRTAVGSLITGLQTMPSIAWFPLAILLFKLSEGAILFVVVLGAAPSIANGLIAGVDFVPLVLLRAGRVLGARGLGLFWHVVLPASLPSYVGGLKQGWAFAWRSLMAGELLVSLGTPSVGARLTFAREFNDSAGLLAVMIVILVLGLLADGAFGAATSAIRRRWGLADPASA